MSTTGHPTTAPNTDELRSQFWDSLSQELSAGLDSATPGRLLTIASTLLDVTSHPDADPESTAVVVRGLAAWNRPETSAGALAGATLTRDGSLRRWARRDLRGRGATRRRWARRDLGGRGHTVPRWLADLHLAAPADRAVELSDPFREVDDVVLSVTIPSGHALTAVVHVDNELGARAIDGALFEQPIEEVLHQLRGNADPDLHTRNISAADARARLSAALTGVSLDGLPTTGTRWPAQRCVVRWMLSRFPSGGDSAVPGRQDDADTDELAIPFLASP